MGLVISKRLCELTGGRIWVRSEEGHGSVFSFTAFAHTPASAEQVASQVDAAKEIIFESAVNPASSCSPVVGRAGPDDAANLIALDSNDAPEEMPPLCDDKQHNNGGFDPRVLVAEDNPINQKVVLRLLMSLGYRNTFTVTDGARAVRAVREAQEEGRPFHVILMVRQKQDVKTRTDRGQDLHMPEMDGISATKAIRASLANGEPFIVACTADLQKGVREECMAVGINEFIGKPIKRKELAKSLRHAVQRLEEQRAARISERPM